MADKRQEIRQFLFENDRTKKWLKDKLPHLDIYYLLSDNCKKFDVDDYDEIIKVFKREGIISNEIDRCKELTNTVLKIDSLLGSSLDLLNSNVSLVTADNELTFIERRKVADLLDEIDLNFEKRVDEVKKILGIKC